MKIILFISLFFSTTADAQKIDSIYVNLYTDSLKKGTFNYINIDGMADGNFMPLDTSVIRFDCSYGEFFGNSLWIPEKNNVDKVLIKATVKKQPSLYKEFTIYIKKGEDPLLKTEDEVIQEMKMKTKTKTKSKKA